MLGMYIYALCTVVSTASIVLSQRENRSHITLVIWQEKKMDWKRAIQENRERTMMMKMIFSLHFIIRVCTIVWEWIFIIFRFSLASEMERSTFLCNMIKKYTYV